MSQLSFASFFDQAREAAPLTPAKPVLPTVNAQPILHRMMPVYQRVQGYRPQPAPLGGVQRLYHAGRQRAGYGADKNAREY